jgi:DNA-binding CsgD family transcriptional regulator
MVTWSAVVSQITNFESGDPVFAVDRGGVIVLWNQAAEKTFGYPASTALGQRCWKLLCGYDTYDNQYCSRKCNVRDMALRHKLVNGFKVNYKTASDERKRFEISCLTVFDDPGNELLLHLCRPEEGNWNEAGHQATSETANNNHCDALSRRELEALVLLANGMNNHEIATAMSISIPTVRNHIQHLLHKLKVHSRLEAVVVARQLKLI